MRKLKASGFVPAVIYGAKDKAETLQVSRRDINAMLSHAAGERCDWHLVAVARSSLAFLLTLALSLSAGVRLVLFKPAILWMRSLVGSLGVLFAFGAKWGSRARGEPAFASECSSDERATLPKPSPICERNCRRERIVAISRAATRSILRMSNSGR